MMSVSQPGRVGEMRVKILGFPRAARRKKAAPEGRLAEKS